MPKKSAPTWSARTPCSTTLRIVWACDSGRSSRSWVTSPKVSRPRTSGNGAGLAAGDVTASDGAVVTAGLLSGGSSVGPAVALGGLGAQGQLELGPAQCRAEDGTARFEEAPGAQAAEPGGVVTDAFDDFRRGRYRARIVTGHAERPALRRACGTAFIVQFVVTDVIEGLDHHRPGQLLLDDLAAAVPAIFEHPLDPIDRRPVVHGVNDELAGQRCRVQRREPVQRDRQHHDVR